MTGTRYTTIQRLVAAAMLATTLGACNELNKTDTARKPGGTDPSGQQTALNNESLPTLAEIQPAVSPFPAPPAEAPLVDKPIIVQKMIFAREDGRVDLALDALQPVELPDDRAALWRANGLRLARLPADRLALWAANLPEPITVSGINILPGLEHGRVKLVGRRLGRNFVRVVGPDGTARTEKFIGGQYQLLMKLTRRIDQPKKVLIELLPHHHGPKDRFRLHEETPEQQGTGFDELRVLTEAPKREVWLIWSADHSEPPETTIAAGDNETDLTPPRLGEAMMTGLRNGKPVRILLVVLVP